MVIRRVFIGTIGMISANRKGYEEYLLPRRGFAQKAKSLGGTLVNSRVILRKVLTVEIYSQYVKKKSRFA